MGEFVESSITKTAVRKLAAPIEDISAFEVLLNSVIADNPWACTAYQVGTTSNPPVEKTKESYTARVAYQDGDAKTVGQVTTKCETSAGYSANIATILGNTALATATGGTASHNPADDSFSATLKCHDANGEVYTVTFSRTQVTIGSYAAEAIRTAIETWADGVPALA